MNKNIVLAGLAAAVLVALVVANRPSKETAESDSHTHQAAEPARPAPTQAAEPTEQPVPHFHASLQDALPLPKILPASQFKIPVVAKAYRIAARIPEVLAQQPCYCWCDKIGHGSLVDCFATEHGAG